LNIYKVKIGKWEIPGKTQSNGDTCYVGADDITDLFKSIPEMWHSDCVNAIRQITEIKTGLSYYDLEHHELPMTLTH